MIMIAVFIPQVKDLMCVCVFFMCFICQPKGSQTKLQTCFHVQNDKARIADVC